MTGDQWQAIFLSVQVATASTLLSLPLAIAVSWLFFRCRFRGKAILETAVNLPLILPPVVTGYFLLMLFGRRGWVGSALFNLFGVEFVFNFGGAVLAAAIVSFPLMVRAIRLAFDSVDAELIEASRTLGLGSWRTFFRVILPLSRNGVIAGSLLTFARSMGEFGATIMVAGNIAGRTQTIPLYTFEQLSSPDGIDNALPVVLVSVLVAAVGLWLSGFLESSQRGSS